MKNLLYILFILAASATSFGQTFTMGNGNVSACSGTFVDDGGAAGNYSSNANQTYTICSSNAGFNVELLFTAFDLESGFFGPNDLLTIYDGNSTAASVIGVYSGNDLLNQTITATNGCLTFVFDSDGSIDLSGWAATINCVPPCQTVNAVLTNINPAPVGPNDEIRICLGDQITIGGSANYPQNNTYYAQSNATSTFTWYTGGGKTSTGQNVAINYNSSRRSGLYLVVEDVYGCTDTVKAGIVSAGLAPSFSNVVFTANDTVCLDDSITISVESKPTPVTIPPLGVAGVTFLPDGTGASYNSPLNISIFDAGTTYQKGYIDDVFFDMEHSYLGDLELLITCPNGQSAVLKEYPGGGGEHLGEPIDQGTSTAPGVGYQYAFSSNSATYGTMTAEAGNYQYTYTDLLGNNYNNQDYLPAGTYKSFDNIDNQLAGCPLNGTWSITVTDNLSSDDGYIFQWGINFNKIILQDTSGQTILPRIINKTWDPAASIIETVDDSTIKVLPDAPGDYSYTFNVSDDFGCDHDTTINIHIKNRATSNAGIDDRTCLLGYNLSPVPLMGGTNPNWTYFTTGTGTASFFNGTTYNDSTTASDYGIYNFVLTEEVNGCETYPDTVEIEYFQITNTIDIAFDDDTVCIPDPINFTNNSDMAQFSSITWDFGDGTTTQTENPTHTFSNQGSYDLTVTLTTADGCEVDSTFTDTIAVYGVPNASFTFTPFEPIIPETNVTFNDASVGADLTYAWDFAGLGTDSDQNPTFEFPVDGAATYATTLTITNPAGCSDSYTQNVVIKNPLNIFVPNAFSPNEDGVNDEFSISFTNTDLSEFTVRIFDRWGTTMKFAEDVDFSWDGTYKGKVAPIGVYIYEIRWKELGDTESQRKIGHVTIVESKR